MEVVGAEGTVALGALPLSGVVTHLETFVAEHVEALGEHRLLVSGVAAGAAQFGLQTHTRTRTGRTMTGRFFSFFSPLYLVEGATFWPVSRKVKNPIRGSLTVEHVKMCKLCSA